MLLSDKVAIITGGAKGIGRGIAYKFADEGCNIAIVDINLHEAKNTLHEIEKKGREGLAIECDITNSSRLAEMIDQVIGKFGKVDILVNNAGTLLDIASRTLKSIATIPENEWDRLVDINLKGVFLCSKVVVPYMIEKRFGKIINFSSVGAIHPPAVAPHYNSAKAGVIGLTYDMACELGPHNINVNAILPGPIRTSFYDPVLSSKTDAEKDAFFANISKNIPLQRIGESNDIAGAALFLASELSSFITGACIPVTGGLPLQPRL